MFSKSCEYGLRAIIYIAEQSEAQQKVSLPTIAAAINSPQPFTAKILQQLTRHQLVKSIKGPYGGFEISADKRAAISLSDVVKVLDGDAIFTRCGLGLSKCDAASPCPLHFKFVGIKEQLKEVLENTTLQGLLDDDEASLQWLQI